MLAQMGANTSELVFNGLDGSTGQYLLADVEAELARIAQTEEVDPAHLRDVKARVLAAEATFGLVGTVEDPNDLAQTGWGVVFAEGADPAIREALSELLAWRKSQATAQEEKYFQEYSGKRGYHAGETKEQFLRDRGAAPSGPAEPARMPYYLLLVGDPESIPYPIQYQLDVQYAVGRIHFETLDEYAAYARSVVTAERANPRPARAAFFGVANPEDAATRLSSELLIAPLAQTVAQWQTQPRPGRFPWQVERVSGTGATKSRLRQLVGGPDTPALLFTAGHGIGFPHGDSRQEALQGGLVCQDWPGPREWTRAEPIPRDHYLAAEDIGDDARLLGMVAFHFACYGLGTPRLDDYPEMAGGRLAAGGPLGTSLSRAIAPRAFVARLPQRLLGHPRGGALAVIGHVERALGSSFLWQTEGGAQRSSLGVFEGGLSRLLRGFRVGAAIEGFNERYAELCATLSEEIRQIEQFGKRADQLELARMWTSSSDARGYAIFGDPAVRLTVTPETDATVTPTAIDPVSVVRPTIAAVEESPMPEPPEPASPEPEPALQIRTVRVEVDPNTGRIVVTAQLPAREMSTGTGTADPLEFGLVDDVRSAVGASLRSASDQLGTALSKLIADVTSLEVATYVSDDPAGVKYDSRQHALSDSAQQVAMTCIRADGDVIALVPRSGGQVDKELWAVHTEIVERAQAHRAEMIKALSSAASGLLGILKVGL